MNLAKKSTVLLAALSVFAMTSCGGNGGNTQKLTYEKALEWVEKHYSKEDAEPRAITTYNTSWDYSGNKSNDNVIPEKWGEVEVEVVPGYIVKPFEGFVGNKINDVSVYALTEQFGVDSEKAKSSKDKQNGTDNSPVSADYWNKYLTKDLFASRYEGDEYTYYVTGNELHVEEKEEDFNLGGVAECYAKLDDVRVNNYYFGSDGYLKKFVSKIASKNTKVYVEKDGQPVSDTEVELGKADFTVTQTPILPK